MDDKKDSSGLSKNLMQMKFMQRSVLRIEEEKNAEEKQRDIDDEHWVLDIPSNKQTESRYQIEPSYVVCESLNYGRMSFKGCNPEIEKLMKSNNAEKEYKVCREIEKETEVKDDEMAKRYSTLIGIIAKKFSKKRQNNSSASSEDGIKTAKTPRIFPDPKKPQTLNKVKQFLKPAEDDS